MIFQKRPRRQHLKQANRRNDALRWRPRKDGCRPGGDLEDQSDLSNWRECCSGGPRPEVSLAIHVRKARGPCVWDAFLASSVCPAREQSRCYAVTGQRISEGAQSPRLRPTAAPVSNRSDANCGRQTVMASRRAPTPRCTPITTERDAGDNLASTPSAEPALNLKIAQV